MKQTTLLLTGLLALGLWGCDDQGVEPGDQARDPVVAANEQKNEQASGKEALSTGLSTGDRLDNYKASANRLLERIESNATAPELEQVARSLTDESLPILDTFAEKHPECADYLSQAKAVTGLLGTLTVADMELRYHRDEALPETDSRCRSAKNLLVYPATVVIMLQRQGDQASREAMAATVNETLQSVEAVRSNIQ